MIDLDPLPFSIFIPAVQNIAASAQLQFRIVRNTILTQAYHLDDNSIVVIGDGNSLGFFPGKPTWTAYVIDIGGRYTQYAATVNGTNDGSGILQAIVPGPNGQFLIVDGLGNTFAPTFKNAKLNNPGAILVPQITGGLAPCSPATSVLHSVYYDIVNRRVAYGFYFGGGGSGTVSARVYSRNVNGTLTVLSEGPAGNWVSGGNDDYDKTQKLTSQVTSSGTASSGSQFALLTADASLHGGNFFVNPGNSVPCAPPGQRTGAYVSSTSAWGIPTPLDGPGHNYYTGDSIEPNIGVMHSTAGHVMFLGPYFQGAFSFQASLTSNFGNTARFVLGTKYIWVFDAPPAAGGNGTGQIFVAVRPAGIVSGPSGVTVLRTAAVNNARPISLTGRYKA